MFSSRSFSLSFSISMVLLPIEFATSTLNFFINHKIISFNSNLNLLLNSFKLNWSMFFSFSFYFSHFLFYLLNLFLVFHDKLFFHLFTLFFKFFFIIFELIQHFFHFFLTSFHLFHILFWFLFFWSWSRWSRWAYGMFYSRSDLFSNILNISNDIFS